MIRVMMICLGNICRSPMAEFVLKNMVAKRGMADRFEIASAATSTEEIGNPVHPGTRKKLAEVGISTAGKYAVQVKRSDYDYYDYFLLADSSNLRNIRRIIPADPENKIHRLLDFTDRPRDIADPWYTGNFDATYNDVVEGCEAFLNYILNNGNDTEIWDLYKKDGTPAGIDHIRGKTIPNGLYHIVSGAAVRHTDGSYLLMQRDFNKESWPGYWELGANGSITKGETPAEGVIRELKEECGIDCKELELIFVSRGIRSFYYNYLCITDCPKDSITLQTGETIAYRWVSREEFISFMKSDEAILGQKERWAPYLELL